MTDNLFNPEAFEQMPGQISMEQDEPINERCEDRWGNLRDARYPNAVFGQQHPTLYPNITLRSVTVNGRCSWGSMLECHRCGAERVQLTGSSVSYEDGPYHFSVGHDCAAS